MKGPALTWDDLADIYDEETSGRKARTLPMEDVFHWAENQTERFFVDPKEGTLHCVKEEE